MRKTLTAYYNRGNTYAKKGDHAKAIADFTEAIRLNPNDTEAHYSRGCEYSEKGDHDQAIVDLTAAIRLNPHSAVVYRGRALVYMQQEDFDKAIVDNTEAIRLEPQSAKAFRCRAEAYLEQGNSDQGIADLNEAMRLDWERGGGKGDYHIKENTLIARLHARFMKSNQLACVVGKTIHLHNTSTAEFLRNERWVKHELVHIRQFQQYGFLRCTIMYLWELWKVGYWNNKYEVEARAEEFL